MFDKLWIKTSIIDNSNTWHR